MNRNSESNTTKNIAEDKTAAKSKFFQAQRVKSPMTGRMTEFGKKSERKDKIDDMPPSSLSSESDQDKIIPRQLNIFKDKKVTIQSRIRLIDVNAVF